MSEFLLMLSDFLFNTFQVMFDALGKALPFGVPLTIAVTTIVEAIKRNIKLPGELPRYIALGLGTLFGGMWLLYGGEFTPPTFWWDFVKAFVVAFVWAFGSPFFYELLKSSAARGAAKTHLEVEEAAVLSLGNMPTDELEYDHSKQQVSEPPHDHTQE